MAEVDVLLCPSTKVAHSDPWRADKMDIAAAGMDWGAKDVQKSAGNFDADYEALCRLFEVPAHPCLGSRRPKEATEGALDAKLEKPTSASKPSTIQLRNYTVDLTTLHLMMKALKTSSDVDTVIFHNAGLTEASVAVLVGGLQLTSVRSLGLDYNLPSSPSLVRPSASERRLKAAMRAAEARGNTMENEVASTTPSSRPDFAGLVREGSKLKALSLRGNGLGDADAVDLAEAIEENTVLCSLNLFDNKITDVGATTLAKTLRLNTVLRGLSLSRNSLTSASAEAFGLLLAGGYEISAVEQEKRALVEAKIVAQNKIAQDAMKKKKDARVETRLPLSTVVVQTAGDGINRAVAGGSRSLATLNLGENRELGAGGALLGLLARIVEARKEEVDKAASGAAGVVGSGAGAVVLQELHLARCQEYAEQEVGGGEHAAAAAGGDQAGMFAAMSLALRPTKVVL